jgi:hypothetical protein
LKFLEILIRIFCKNSEIFLKKCQKVSYVSLGRSWRVEILHEHALLVAASNYILRNYIHTLGLFEIFSMQLDP